MTIGRMIRTNLATYTTTFPATENPISQGSVWLNGLATAIDWSDMQTTPGLAFGTQTGPVSPPYDDSMALYTGAGQWTDMELEGQIRIANRNAWDGFHEVELLLRGTMSANLNRCYECVFSLLSGGTYCGITRVNGALNDFTDLSTTQPSPLLTLSDGDLVKARIVGTTISIYANESALGGGYRLLMTSTDSTYSVGYPGMGHWRNGTSNLDDYGFTSWTARQL